jgi:Flp pilus assembly protein TadB
MGPLPPGRTSEREKVMQGAGRRSVMSGDPDDVVLNEWERERLAAMEGQLAATDPRFSRRLSGKPRVDPHPAIATVMFIVGATTVIATFTRWLWLAITGLAVMTVGGIRMISLLAARLRRRHLRRTQD